MDAYPLGSRVPHLWSRQPVGTSEVRDGGTGAPGLGRHTSIVPAGTEGDAREFWGPVPWD